MHIAIIGNGISGTTAARHIRKLSDYSITLISSETKHFFSRTALMYIYMGHMKFEHTKSYEDMFWENNQIKLMYKFVRRIEISTKQLIFSDNTSLKYDKLIIACGSKSNKFGWEGQDLRAVQGLYSYQDLQSMEQYSMDTKQAVIIGGGLIGVEMAEMFHSRHIPVSFLVREQSFWSSVLPPNESSLINKEIIRNNIDLRLNTELKKIISDENGRVKAVITQEGEKIDCQFVGLTKLYGVGPNIGFLKNSG